MPFHVHVIAISHLRLPSAVVRYMWIQFDSVSCLVHLNVIFRIIFISFSFGFTSFHFMFDPLMPCSCHVPFVFIPFCFTVHPIQCGFTSAYSVIPFTVSLGCTFHFVRCSLPRCHSLSYRFIPFCSVSFNFIPFVPC